VLDHDRPVLAAEPIEAHIVDAETKQPLEGVIVTANWQLEEGTFGGNVQVGQLVVMEAVTNKDGKFRFPGWGPKTVWKGHLVSDDPQLLLFKSGYEYKRLYNHVSMPAYREHVLKPVRRSDWNGKTIALKRFRGTMKEYVRHLSFFMTDLRFIEDNCHWKQTPRMILELQQQSESFRAAGIITAIYSVDYLPTVKAKCGSPQEFFRSYRP